MKITKFDKQVVEQTINAVHSGLEFFYIANAFHSGFKKTIGSCSQEYFDRITKDEITGIYKATYEEVQSLLDADLFLNDEAQGLMIKERAKIYLEELKNPKVPYLKLVSKTAKIITYRDEEIKTTWKVSLAAKRLYRKSDPLYTSQDIKFSDDFIRFEIETFLIEKSSKYRKRVLKVGGWNRTSCNVKQFIKL
jgi:hypothetical protein